MDNVPVKNTGDQLPATEWNSPTSENKNIVTSVSDSLGGDSFQVSRAVATYAAGSQYYTDSGAADAYVLTPVGSKKAPHAYFDGMLIRFRTTNANTGASTVNVASLGVKDIKLADGSTNPLAGDIGTTSDTYAVYDGTNFRLLNIEVQRLNVVGDVDVGGNLSVTGGFSKIALSGTPAGTPDANTLYKDNIVKAWLNMNIVGVIAIRDSFNVSSIVDNGGTGDITVNWDLDFADVNYAWTGSGCLNRVIVGQNVTFANFQTASSLRILNIDTAAGVWDDEYIGIIAIGNQ